MAGALALGLGVSPAVAGAALVFDTTDEHVLYAEDPDAPWYPASLTKMMTAYLAFEAIRDGKSSDDTDVVVSENARKQPPSRLGLKVGTHLTLGDALKALIMRSANDIAVAIAETLGGDEMSFVKQMNQKAAELGMMHTHFINPNGLPAEQQVTTARDMALLSNALLRDFPARAPLYAEKQDTIMGKKVTLGTHNAILTNFEGGDGIKTGFTCASGYNLAASATRDGRRIIAIVLGETSSAKRTARASALLEHGFAPTNGRLCLPRRASRTFRARSSAPTSGPTRPCSSATACARRLRRRPRIRPATQRPRRRARKRPTGRDGANASEAPLSLGRA